MAKAISRAPDERVNWRSSIPFLAVHLLPLAAVVTGVTARAVAILVVTFWGRLFFITAGYHRYFAHRSYRLGRTAQFVMAFGGGTAAQKGMLWWSGHHRAHHRFAGGEGWHNNHHHYQSSARQGFFWWEIDPTYYVLRLLRRLGIVRGLREPSARVIASGLVDPPEHASLSSSGASR